jgi:hypothetical protein
MIASDAIYTEWITLERKPPAAGNLLAVLPQALLPGLVGAFDELLHLATLNVLLDPMRLRCWRRKWPSEHR